MNPYLALKTIHIVSATVLFGTGIGIAFFMLMGQRSGHRATQLATARWTVLADTIFTAPAAALQLVSGFMLVHMGGWSLGAPWIVISLALFFLIGGCWLVVVVLQLRMRDQLQKASKENLPLPESYYRYFRIWFILGWPAFIGIPGIFWLMVAKPLA